MNQRPPINVVLVSSQVTYIPGNYLELFRRLLQNNQGRIHTMVLLQNRDWKTLRTAAALLIIGARRVGGTLLWNFLARSGRPTERLCRHYGVPCRYQRTMNTEPMAAWIKEQHIDLIANMRTRCIYRAPILQAPRLGCINVHHGLLPKYRGTLCDLYALTENRPAGFTLHVMDEKVDAGRILARQVVSQTGDRDYLAYLAKTMTAEAAALTALFEEIEQTGALPEGLANACDHVVYTRNPDRSQIKAFRRLGMKL